jgi:antitoxin VapB
MSLNIKNERTHALVRQLADRTGLSQTSVVEEAVRRWLEELETEPSTRLARVDAIVRQIQVELTDDEREALMQASDDMYDESGLPR